VSEPFPTPTDAAYIKRLREDYPETCEGHDDEWVMDHYNPSGFKYVECTLWDHVGDAARDFERLADEHLPARQQYHELLYAVSQKFPGETRHETALRYIRAAEARASEPGEAKQEGKPGEPR
jgi:hypothetical protein